MPVPNVLIIMCDQLNAGVLSCYGGPVPTPNIDRIAGEGVRFTDAVCPTPFCSPSRASLVLGTYPHRHGIVSNVNRRDYPAIPAPPAEEGIKASDDTTESILSGVGYRTHHYGKWHLLHDDLPYFPDMFLEHHQYAELMKDRFEQVRRLERASWMDWYDWALPVTPAPALREAVGALGGSWHDKHFAEFITKMGRLDLPLEQNFDVLVADRAVECLQESDSEPFMLTCSFNYPHDPNVVPSPYYEMFTPEELSVPENFEVCEGRFEQDWSRQIVRDLGLPGVRGFLRIDYASVKLVDDQVGRILGALEEGGLADDTIVLFTSDHGDMAGGHGMVWKSTHAFYDEVVRVPLLVRYPRRIEPSVNALAANLTDLMPTLLELVGQRVPDHVQGTSLAPFLLGTRPMEDGPVYAFCERVAPHPEHRRALPAGTPGSFMVRGGGWKYIRYTDGEELLYDLQLDPLETENRAGRQEAAATRASYAGVLDGWLRETLYPGM